MKDVSPLYYNNELSRWAFHVRGPLVAAAVSKVRGVQPTGENGVFLVKSGCDRHTPMRPLSRPRSRPARGRAMLSFETLEEALEVIEALEADNTRLREQVDDWRNRALCQESLNEVEYLRTVPGDWGPESEGWMITIYAKEYWLYTRPKQRENGSGHQG